MARSRKMRKTRKNRMHGGGATIGWQPDGRLAAEASYAMVNKMYDGCMNTARPGAMAFSMGSGLPGMRGGAYSVNPGSSLAPGVPEISRDPSHCMRGGKHTRKHTRKHHRKHTRKHHRKHAQRGGVGAMAANNGAILQDGPLSYSQAAGSWKDSVGAPVLINQPYNPVMLSKACSQTGGRRKSRKLVKKSRKSRTAKYRIPNCKAIR
jgi:hypothetical protein